MNSNACFLALRSNLALFWNQKWIYGSSTQFRHHCLISLFLYDSVQHVRYYWQWFFNRELQQRCSQRCAVSHQLGQSNLRCRIMSDDWWCFCNLTLTLPNTKQFEWNSWNMLKYGEIWILFELKCRICGLHIAHVLRAIWICRGAATFFA